MHARRPRTRQSGGAVRAYWGATLILGAESALIGNTACDEARICKLKCKRGDCDCEAKCFDGKPECEELAAVVDACVLEQCAPICK